jgi:hypothetical protein
MIEIYLNGNLIELETPTAFSLTRQINNFAELKDRQATFTNSFKAPKTKNNLEIFTGLGIVGNQSRAPYQFFTAVVKINSVPVVLVGKAFVKSFDTDFQINIVDDNIHLFDKLGDKKLSDLDLSVLNHDLTTTNFVNSFTNDYTDGYIYAISDFGNFNPSAIVINNQLPSLFVRYIWDKILSEAGFLSDFEPENDLLITPKRGYDTVEDAGTATEINCTAETSEQGYQGSGYLEKTAYINLTPDQTIGNITSESGSITVTSAGIYYYDFSVDDSDNFNLAQLYLKVKVNNSIVASHDVWNMGTATGQLNLSIGDLVSFEYLFIFELYEYDAPYANIDTAMTFYTVIGGSGLTVNIQSFIGEVKQTDFIKDIMQHYCLLSKKTKDANEMQFIQAKDLLTDKANAIDWSGKVVFSSEDYDTDYSQKNIFKYGYRQQDGEQFADGILSIYNNTLKSDNVELTRPYNAPEVSESLLNGGLVRYTPFWEAERDDAGNITKWKVIKGKNYFGRKIQNEETITYKIQSGTNQTHTGTVPRLSFDYLNYQSILDENYKEVQQMLNWSRSVKVKVRLNLFEFDSFDFFNLVFIKELGGYFYVNSLKWTNRKSEVDAELIYVPMSNVNSTVARIGAYPRQTLVGGDIVLQLDGSMSKNYESVNWYIISSPDKSDIPTLSDDEIINPSLTIIDDIKNVGDYIIEMTLNEKTENEVKSTTLITVQ